MYKKKTCILWATICMLLFFQMHYLCLSRRWHPSLNSHNPGCHICRAFVLLNNFARVLLLQTHSGSAVILELFQVFYATKAMELENKSMTEVNGCGPSLPRMASSCSQCRVGPSTEGPRVVVVCDAGRRCTRDHSSAGS